MTIIFTSGSNVQRTIVTAKGKNLCRKVMAATPG
jgi:hypothetical protein